MASTIIAIVGAVASVAGQVYDYAKKSKEEPESDPQVEEMLRILNDLQAGQAELRSLLSVLLATTEWRAHEEIVIEAYQLIDFRYDQLLGFGSNPDFDTEEAQIQWADDAIDDMTRALSDIGKAIMGETSPTLNPLVTEFKNYYIAQREGEGYVYRADQQVVLRYFLFLINRQSQAYSVIYNARELKGSTTDDFNPEEEFQSQYAFVEGQALKAITSFWETPPKDRGSNSVPIWPPGDAHNCPVKDFALGENKCSPGKVVIGVRFRATDYVGGIDMCEATVGPLGIPKEAGTWIAFNQSELQYHSSSTKGLHENSFNYNNSVDEGEMVDVVTGIHIAYDSSVAYFHTRVHFTKMSMLTGELDDATGRWEEQPRDYDKSPYDWESLDCLPVEGASALTGIKIGRSDDRSYRINALKTVRVATQ